MNLERGRSHAQAEDVGQKGASGALHFLVGDALAIRAPAAARRLGVVAAHQPGFVGLSLPVAQVFELFAMHDLDR